MIPPFPARLTFLRTRFPAVLVVALVLMLGLCGLARADDMATVEQRILAELMSSVPSDSTITSRISQLGANGLWPTLNYTTDPSSARNHLFYMRDMAEGYNNPASIHYLSTTVLDKYMLAFDGWVIADPDDSNWWWRAIAFPKALGEAMLLMKSSFTSARLTSGVALIQRSYLARSNVGATNTGANRTDRSYATLLRALITNNSALLTESFLSIGDAIEYTTLEGMQPDGSYQQHGAQLYVGGYGLVFVNGISQYATYGVGTQYTYSPRQIREFTDFLLDGAQWFTRGPVLDYASLGRSITKTNATTQRATNFIGGVSDTIPLAGAYRAAELSALLARLQSARDSGVADPATALVGNRGFWRSDYMAHHRPGFMASVKAASTRTIESELINEEGKKSLHMSDGMLLLHRRGDEYNGLMPVWDWQRLPGTTLEQAAYSLRPASPAIFGNSTHAGGVSDGYDGAFAFIYSKRNVSARKSWFFIGDSIVALGAAVNAPASTSAVLTTLNQSLLKSPVTYSTGGAAQTLTTGTVTPAGLQWVHHDDTGYFFFTPQNAATVRAQPQSGTQFGIDGETETTANTTLQTADVFSLDVNHGTAFSGGSYAYVVAPGLAAAAMPNYALGDLTVLNNTSDIQAVKSTSRGLTLANFFAAGTTDGITVSHSCSILVRDLDGVLEVTVSDPKQTIAGDFTIQIARPTAGLIDADGPVTVDQLGPTLTLRVNLAASTGRSLRAKFYTTADAYTTVILDPTADADVLDGSGNTNFGNTTTLRTKFDSSTGDWTESYLKFNLLGLPNTLAAARLVLNPTALSTTPALHSVAPVATSTWTETGLTWNNRPQPNGPPTTLWLPRASQVVRADVGPLLPDFVHSDGHLGLWVAPRMQSAALVSFASRNHATTSLRPKLELTFASAFGPDNSAGAVVSVGSAQLRGWLIGATADVSIYWGQTDGGATAANWANVITLPGSVGGSISGTISSLAAGSTYYYRLYATGPSGTAWAPQTASFNTPTPATVQLDNLAQTYTATPRPVTATTTPAGLSVSVTYAGGATAPTAAGSYAIVATITDPVYVGGATGTLVVAKATPTIATPPTASGILAGEPLSASTLSGGSATVLGTPASGTFAFAAPATVPAAGTFDAPVHFVPTDTANFNIATGGQTSVAVAENLPPVVVPGANQGAVISGTSWTPALISTLAWYDAADAGTVTTVGGAVSQWTDKSGNNRHAQPASTAQRPTHLASDPMLGGRPSIGTLDASGSIGLLTPVLAAKNIYVVTYYKDGLDASFDDYPTLLSGPGVNGEFRVMGLIDTTDFIATNRFNDAGSFANGSTAGSDTILPLGATVLKFKASTARVQGYRLGYNNASGARGWQGHYGEWLFTDGTETADTEKRIEAYLAHKWGLGEKLPADHPYKAPTSIASVAVVTLAGSATDPENRTLTYTWSVVSGPAAAVSFANPSAARTTATFGEAGVYTLRLTASDGAVTSFNDLNVTVGTAATSHTVTFDARGGTAPAPATIQATFAGTYGPLSTPTRSGHQFVGWFTAPTGGSLVTADSSVATDADHTLYARWNGPPTAQAGSDQLIPLDQWRPWTPADTSTAAWYDADDATTLAATAGAVSAWADKSGHANHLAQNTSTAQPATGIRTLGGRNVVAFDADNDHFMDALHSASLNFDASGGLSTFLVFRTPGYNEQGGTTNSVFGKGSAFSATPGFGLTYNASFNPSFKFADADTRSLTLGTSYLNTPLLVSTTADHATGAQGFYVNGGSLSGTRAATPPRTSDTIGDFRVGGIAPTYSGGPGYSTITRYADVDVGELLLVPGALSLADRQRFEGYLAHKWALTASLPIAHPHKSQSPGSLVAIAQLNGSASDAGGDALTHIWSFVSGPAAAVFGDASALSTTVTLPAEGDYTLRLTSSDGVFTAFDEVVITVGDAPPPSPFAVWAGLAADGDETLAFTADANGDGVADGLAWLLAAASPTTPATAHLPTVSAHDGDLRATFTLRAPDERGLAVVKLQYSPNLATWTTVTVPDTSGIHGGLGFTITPVGDMRSIEVTIPVALVGGGARIFLRILAELPPP